MFNIEFNKADQYYIQNLDKILTQGNWDENPRPKWKDGTPAYNKFITQVFEEYDLSKNEFPITTLRKTAIKTGIKEIFWIYQKQSNSLNVAHKLNVKWWDDWNIGDGTIGQRYGATVKRYDLIENLLYSLKNNSFSRRHIMNLYQYVDLNETKGLFPCAYETIWSVRKNTENKYFLDLTMIQRSNDYIVAGYINKIQYVALQMMIASHLGFEVGKFVHLVQNLHIYDRHLDAAKELLHKRPLEIQPYLTYDKNVSFYDADIGNFNIHGVGEIENLDYDLEVAV